MKTDRNSPAVRNKPNRVACYYLVGILLTAITILLLLTFDRTRELGERILSSLDLLPLPKIPEVYDIQGYPAASEKVFGRFLKQSNNHALFVRLKEFLQLNQVAQMIPPFPLLRQGSAWLDQEEPPLPFAPRKTGGPWYLP